MSTREAELLRIIRQLEADKKYYQQLIQVAAPEVWAKLTAAQRVPPNGGTLIESQKATVPTVSSL